MTVGPELVTQFQHLYITKLSGMFSYFVKVATHLFYWFAIIEVVLFGLAWAMRQSEALGSLVFKIFKLSIIFFLITSYPVLLEHLINGFTDMSGHVIANTDSTNYLFNPGAIWHLGFNSSIEMLKLAVRYGSANVGMSLIYIILGFGTLFMFGLIGATIVLFVVGFYLVSIVALILLPFSALSIMRNFLTRALTSVFSMGVRIFALVIVLGIGFAAWSSLNLHHITASTTLGEPLGLFFVTLVILVLALKVPTWTAQSVGEIGGSIFDELKSAVQQSGGASTVVTPPAAVQAVAAATNVNVSAVAGAANLTANVAAAGGGSATGAAANTVVHVHSGSSASGATNSLLGGVGASKATQVGISDKTLNKLKSTFKQAMKENNQKGS